jgi:hypothetical protein
VEMAQNIHFVTHPTEHFVLYCARKRVLAASVTGTEAVKWRWWWHEGGGLRLLAIHRPISYGSVAPFAMRRVFYFI